jgi:hypothetical protein
MPCRVCIGNPGGDLLESRREQVNIETEIVGAQTDALFLWRQEVKEQRADTSSAYDLSHVLIAWTVTAATAPVCKEHNAARLCRNVYVTIQRCFARWDVYAIYPLCLRGCMQFTHGSFLLGRASASWAGAA